MLEWLSPEFLAFAMFGVALMALLAGYPVALTLGGTAVVFALLADRMGLMNIGILNLYPSRIFGAMRNETLMAVPLFVFMGVMLEKSELAARLLTIAGRLFGTVRGGLGISVVLVGALLAASTGIVGATVVTMGVMSLPVLLRAGYDPKLASGLITASGTLGQIIPPSIVLILLGDVLQGANEAAGKDMGVLAPEPVTVIDLFAGALVPGLLLVAAYVGWIAVQAWRRPDSCPALAGVNDGASSGRDGGGGIEGSGRIADLAPGLANDPASHGASHGAVTWGEVFWVLVPPLALIFVVLGSILTGAATPTESASVGAVGATILAAFARTLSWRKLGEVARQTVQITAMVFLILLGAQLFSLVFRTLGGDGVVEHALSSLPGGKYTALLVVMLALFALGFFLDFIEIIFMVVPIVGPVLIVLGFDPIWLGVLIGINLQTSFLTPPFGFSLFYLRGVAPPGLATTDIYRGALPFIAIQLTMIGVIWCVPQLATWLPDLLG